MLSIGEVASNLNICKNFALSLPRFYKKTGISAQLVFAYSKENEGIEISLGFTPHQPTEEEYKILFEEITDAEKLLSNEYVINNSSHFENINQLVFKLREEMQQIISKHKHET